MKKFVIIICLSLMGFSIASQISFNSGMLSEILKFRIDFDKRSMALEDSENMLVQPEGPIFRRTGTEFIDEALTEFSYTVTDTNDSNDPNTPIYGDYTEYFVGIYGGGSYYTVVNVSTSGSVDTSWGDSGYWGDSTLGINYGFIIHSMSDGRLLIAHNTAWNDGGMTKLYELTMLTSDGVVDTTWGYDGHYATYIAGEYSYRDTAWGVAILEDDDGNFYYFGSPNAGSPYSTHKISSDGFNIAARAWSTAPAIPGYWHGAVWGDDDKTRIIAVGNSGNYPSGYMSNCVAIDPDTLEPDTAWGGMGYDCAAGYANVGPEVTTNATETGYAILKVSDGFIIGHTTNEDGYAWSKINLDGTGYVTSWGTNGHYGTQFHQSSGRKICQDSDGNVYLFGDAAGDQTIQILVKLDSTGSVLASHEFDGGAVLGVYFNMFMINDKLYFFTLKQSPAQYYIEVWNTDLEYESGFDGATGYCLVPDESTREVTYTGGGDGETTTTTTIFATSDKTRLIPFTYSNTDNYVLEFGHNFVGFLR